MDRRLLCFFSVNNKELVLDGLNSSTCLCLLENQKLPCFCSAASESSPDVFPCSFLAGLCAGDEPVELEPLLLLSFSSKSEDIFFQEGF